MKKDDVFILFYSNYCEHCKDFLIKLRNLDKSLFSKFDKICVDNNTNIPKEITSVPTIITPTHNYALTDNSVFIWLDTMASEYIDKTNTNISQDTGNSNHLNSKENPDEIVPFIRNEMGSSFSDNFSFLDDVAPLEHNFSFIGSDNSNITDNQIPNNQIPNNQIPNNQIPNNQIPNNQMTNNQMTNNQMADRNMSHPVNSLSQLDFQLDRPEMAEKNYNNNFEQKLDSFKNERDSDPFIMQAPQRR